jgi:hypothetical protein
VGECGHEQHVVDYRTKQILTMMGKVEFKRAYYQCQRGKEQKGEEEEQKQRCSGRAPADQVWGIDQRRTTPGVQEAIGYLCARLTFEEAAETFSRFFPLKMTARQAQNLMEPVGKALAEEEEKVLKALFEQATHKHTSLQEQQELLAFKGIERLYIEMDGIMERLRRSTVEMEASEHTRKGDVYRELKVGVIFEAERGRERSGLAPEVWIDTPKQASQRYVARRTAKGDQLLYGLACQSGLSQAKQVVILGDGAPWRVGTILPVESGLEFQYLQNCMFCMFCSGKWFSEGRVARSGASVIWSYLYNTGKRCIFMLVQGSLICHSFCQERKEKSSQTRTCAKYC